MATRSYGDLHMPIAEKAIKFKHFVNMDFFENLGINLKTQYVGESEWRLRNTESSEASVYVYVI